MVSYFINKLLGKVFGTVLNVLINFIVTPIVEIYYVVIVTNVSYYLFNVSTLMLSIVDFLSDMFRMFAGVSEGLKLTSLEHMIAGQTIDSNDLLIQMLFSKQVAEMFIAVATVGLFLIMICSMVAIIKQEFNMEKANNKTQILGAAFKSFISMMFVPVICIFGVFVANQVLQLIDIATGGSDDMTISGVIFSTATVDAYYDDELSYMVSLANPLESSVNGGLSAAISTLLDNIADVFKIKEATIADIKVVVGGIFGFRSPLVKVVNDDSIFVYSGFTEKDGIKLPNYTEAVKKTANSDQSRLVVSAYKEFVSSMYTSVKAHDLKNPETANLEVHIGGYKAWLDGDYVKIQKEDSSGDVYSVKTNTWGQLFSEYGDELVGISENCYRVYYNGYQVTADFHPAKINYLIIFFAAGAVIKALFGAIIGLMMRVYQGVALYIVLPLVIGISPLDEGGAFNNWKTQFISQVVGGYSAIIAVNLFLLLCGWFIKIDLSYVPTNQILQSMNLADVTYLSISFIMNSNVIRGLFRTLFIVTGALMIQDFSKIVADIFGIFDAMGEGNSFASNLKNEFGKVTKFGVGVAAGGAALTAKGASGIANKVTKFQAHQKMVKPSVGGKSKFGYKAKAGLDQYKKNWAEGNGVLASLKGVHSARKEAGADYKALVEKDKKAWEDSADLRKTEKKERRAVKKAARKYAGSKVGFLGALTSGNLRAYKNTRFLAEQSAMERYDEANAAYKAALDTGDDKKASEAKGALNDTIASTADYLADEKENKKLSQSIIDAKEAEDMNLKTNMKWGLSSLTDMIPGLKTLRDLKSDTEGARKKVASKNETLSIFAASLDEMAKDNRKEDDKGRHKDYHAKEALLNAKTLANALELEAARAAQEEEQNMKNFAEAFKTASSMGNVRKCESLKSAAENRGYNFSIENGEMKFTTKPEPIKIDPSKFKSCSNEKEMLDLMKKEIGALKKDNVMMANILEKAVAAFKAQADKK